MTGLAVRAWMAQRWQDLAANRRPTLPIVVLCVTARCNSRCIACDWWRSQEAGDLPVGELTVEELESLAADLRALHTQRLVFSGGEPLVRPEVYEIAGAFRAQGIALELLTNGLALERDAEQVLAHFQGVTISLDGHTPELTRQIRGVDGLEQIERGVARLKRLRPSFPMRARCVLQRANYCHMAQLIDKAKAMGLAQISFLAADVSSAAYGRAGELDDAESGASRSQRLLLDAPQVAEFAQVVEDVLQVHRDDVQRRFVAESAERLRRLPRYYAALLGLEAFPPVVCNAPWVSAVIEADGAVRPCFPQSAVGNIRTKPLRQILQDEMFAWRAAWDRSADPVCARCVCTLQWGSRRRP